MPRTLQYSTATNPPTIEVSPDGFRLIWWRSKTRLFREAVVQITGQSAMFVLVASGVWAVMINPALGGMTGAKALFPLTGMMAGLFVLQVAISSRSYIVSRDTPITIEIQGNRLRYQTTPHLLRRQDLRTATIPKDTGIQISENTRRKEVKVRIYIGTFESVALPVPDRATAELLVEAVNRHISRRA